IRAGDRALFAADDFSGLGAPEAGEWRAEHPEPPQNVASFLASRPNLPTAARRIIYVQPIGTLDPDGSPPLEAMAELAELYFGLPVTILPAVMVGDVEARGRANEYTGAAQLLAPEVMTWLQRRLPDDAYAIIALTDVDLYPEDDWNFVFGMGAFKERVGVHSFARYHPRFYGERVEPDAARHLVLRRSLRVLVHELGHMFGIHHCTHYACVMNGSNSLAESDTQPMHLCPIDLRKLQLTSQLDLHARYQALAAFYARHGLTDEAAWTRKRSATSK
ncbi:MAG TPA: archaemetzincin, partial [Kofleriaceae bacterium]|nr:archaemetzincin [Kofleriaceae bacterium]